MTRDELIAALNSIEWTDVEFKEATWEVPRSALSTVSAFANSEGGHLVFGVKEANGTFKVAGVVDVDKVQNTFLGQVRDLNKISALLPITASAHQMPEGVVLVFFVPEAARNQKPVHLERNPRNSYIRRGGRDDACTADELMRLMRDASPTRYDADPLALDIDRCFDITSVRWYREMFSRSNAGRDDADDELTFLRKRGFIVEQDGKLMPTRAGLLVLGAAEVMPQVLPRMVADLQLYRHAAAEYSPTTRWADRVAAEGNLVQAWRTIVEFYFRHSERPFSIDAQTLRRSDDPPDYVSFREAAINLLIHQDFSDHGRVPTIRMYRDCTELFNPGDAFQSREKLLDPGDKETRNPSIVGAFRRIGLSDQGGTGIGAIFESWRQLGYLPPEIENDKAEKTFRLRLPKQKLQSEAQLLAMASLGVRLTAHQAAVFAYLLVRGEADVADIKGLTGLSGPYARGLAEQLASQVLVEPIADGDQRIRLVSHLRERFAPSGSEPAAAKEGGDSTYAGAEPAEPAEPGTRPASKDIPKMQKSIDRLSDAQWKIVAHSDAPRSINELLQITGYRHNAHFRKTHLGPLLEAGIMRMTSPEKRYVLTDNGIRLKAWRALNSPSGQTDAPATPVSKP